MTENGVGVTPGIRTCNLVRFGAFAFYLGLAVAAYGQTVTTGDLTGAVRDASGAVVPTAPVTLKSADTGETRTEQTNSSGTYRFTFVKPGNYTISASSAGLVSDTRNVVVEVGQAITLDIVAKVQSVGQTIEVSESAAFVNTDYANLTATFTAKQMDELPMPGGDITTRGLYCPRHQFEHWRGLR